MKSITFNGLIVLFWTLLIAMFPIPSQGSEPKGVFPILQGWKIQDQFYMPIKSAKGIEGLWAEATYKRTPIPKIKVVIIEGENIIWKQLENAAPPESKGLFEAESTYEAVMIKGKKGIMESHPILGISLVLPMTPQKTITFETKGSKTLLLEFVQSFLKEITKDKK